MPLQRTSTRPSSPRAFVIFVGQLGEAPHVLERPARRERHVLEHLRHALHRALGELAQRLARSQHEREDLQRRRACRRPWTRGRGRRGAPTARRRGCSRPRASPRRRSGRRPACARACRPRARARARARGSTSPSRRRSFLRSVAVRRACCAAHIARTWSPSTIWPFSSTTMTRSASPSSAMPIAAPALHDLGADVLGVERARVLVDVHAVRLDADGRHLRAELLKDERRDAVGGAVRGVDDDAHAVEREVAAGTSASGRRRSGRARPRASRRARCRARSSACRGAGRRP